MKGPLAASALLLQLLLASRAAQIGLLVSAGVELAQNQQQCREYICSFGAEKILVPTHAAVHATREQQQKGKL